MTKIPLGDKPGINNWVERTGGLPDYIKRIAEEIKGSNPTWDDGRCIAAAVNTVKRWAVGGTVREHGGPRVKPDTQAKAAAAVAQWEAKKAASRASVNLAVPAFELTKKKRDERADTGAALPDGSYPIFDETSLKSALKLVGQSKTYSRAQVMAHIVKRAKALGLTKLLPDTYDLAREVELARYVRTPDGAKFYGQPIGSLITRDTIARVAGMIGRIVNTRDNANWPSGMSAEERVARPNSLDREYASRLENHLASGQGPRKIRDRDFRELKSEKDVKVGDRVQHRSNGTRSGPNSETIWDLESGTVTDVTPPTPDGPGRVTIKNDDDGSTFSREYWHVQKQRPVQPTNVIERRQAENAAKPAGGTMKPFRSREERWNDVQQELNKRDKQKSSLSDSDLREAGVTRAQGEQTYSDEIQRRVDRGKRVAEKDGHQAGIDYLKEELGWDDATARKALGSPKSPTSSDGRKPEVITAAEALKRREVTKFFQELKPGDGFRVQHGSGPIEAYIEAYFVSRDDSGSIEYYKLDRGNERVAGSVNERFVSKPERVSTPARSKDASNKTLKAEAKQKSSLSDRDIQEAGITRSVAEKWYNDENQKRIDKAVRIADRDGEDAGVDFLAEEMSWDKTKARQKIRENRKSPTSNTGNTSGSGSGQQNNAAPKTRRSLIEQAEAAENAGDREKAHSLYKEAEKPEYGNLIEDDYTKALSGARRTMHPTELEKERASRAAAEKRGARLNAAVSSGSISYGNQRAGAGSAAAERANRKLDSKLQATSSSEMHEEITKASDRQLQAWQKGLATGTAGGWKKEDVDALENEMSRRGLPQVAGRSSGNTTTGNERRWREFYQVQAANAAAKKETGSNVDPKRLEGVSDSDLKSVLQTGNWGGTPISAVGRKTIQTELDRRSKRSPVQKPSTTVSGNPYAGMHQNQLQHLLTVTKDEKKKQQIQEALGTKGSISQATSGVVSNPYEGMNINQLRYLLQVTKDPKKLVLIRNAMQGA